jgi:hypothetical protein
MFFPSLSLHFNGSLIRATAYTLKMGNSGPVNWAAIDIIRRHVSPVAEPAPPAGLLAAARAVIENEQWITTDHCTCGICESIHALRREVEAAPESAPVALTDDEKRHVANRAITLTFRGYGPEKTSIDWCREIVDAFLSDLDELGFELRRRT